VWRVALVVVVGVSMACSKAAPPPQSGPALNGYISRVTDAALREFDRVDREALQAAESSGAKFVDVDIDAAATRMQAAARAAVDVLLTGAKERSGCSSIDTRISIMPELTGVDVQHAIDAPPKASRPDLVVIGLGYDLDDIATQGMPTSIGISVWAIGNGCPPTRRGYFRDFSSSCDAATEVCTPSGGL
jgi:hypothetical protein